MGLMDLAQKVTSAANALSYTKLEDSGLVLTKARFVVYKEPDPGSAKVSEIGNGGEIEFFLNPTNIQIKKSTKIESLEDTGSTNTETRAAKTDPVTLTLPKLFFDTYEKRESVRKKFIDHLEELLEYAKDTHHAPAVMFVWGKFNESGQDKKYMFYVESLDVNYTMFLPDGTPVRAEVGISLKQAFPTERQEEEKPQQSPDHAKLYTVRRGDTLQAIAQREYDNPGEWRRIADTNRLDDPLNLKPGTKLLVPPIIR